jgi:hypothetical protein
VSLASRWTATELKMSLVLWPSGQPFLFVHSEEAAKELAPPYALVVSCTRVGVNPVEDLADVSERIDPDGGHVKLLAGSVDAPAKGSWLERNFALRRLTDRRRQYLPFRSKLVRLRRWRRRSDGDWCNDPFGDRASGRMQWKRAATTATSSRTQRTATSLA